MNICSKNCVTERRVRIGISGSDLHFYRGDWLAMPGIVPGHEFGGIVSAVGSNVDHVREGDVADAFATVLDKSTHSIKVHLNPNA